MDERAEANRPCEAPESGDSAGTAGSAPGPIATSSWPRPLPLTTAIDLPPFPLSSLPDWLRCLVEELSEAMQVPIDLPAVLCLPVLATLVAKTVEVVARAGWVEPVNVYVVVALPPGERKSPVFRVMSAPIEDLERELLPSLKPDDEAEETTPRDVGRLLADDVTQEALAQLMANNGGRMAILSAEGGIFDVLSGRYTDGAPNIEMFLKGHDGDNVRVDRVKRGHEFIERPALTLGLTVQPTVIAGLQQRKSFRGRGLLGRMFFAVPDSLVGRRRSNPTPATPEVLDTYRHYMRAIGMAAYNHRAEPLQLTLAEESHDALVAFMDALEPRLGPDGDLRRIADWGTKLAGRAVRIAALLHVAETLLVETETEISVATMLRGLEIAEYFIPHALAAFDLMGEDEEVVDALRVIAWIERHRHREFSAKEAFDDLKTSMEKMPRMRLALDLLLDTHHLRQMPGERAGGPGRSASPRYAVNPYLLARNPRNPQNGVESPFAQSEVNDK